MLLARRTRAARVVAVTVLFGIALAWYSFLVPMWRAPDERAHIDLVLDVAEDGTYPAWDANLYRSSVLTAAELVAGPLGKTHLDADLAPSRIDRPSLADLGGDRPAAGSYNHMAQHPPVYYGILGLEYRAITALGPLGDVPADRTVALLRLLNAPFVLLVPGVCWWTARRAGLKGSIPMAAALIPLCIPGLAHIGSAVNNDNLLTLLSGVSLALAVGVARGDDGLRTAAALGAAIGLALLTKGSALVLVPLAVGAYWSCVRNAEVRRQALRAAGLCSALVVAGLSWYALNVVRYGELIPTIDEQRFAARPPGFSPSVGEWLVRFGGYMAQGFWGRPGAFDVKLPNPYTTVATVVFLLLVIVGGLHLSSRRGRGLALLLLATLPGMLALVGANSYRLYASSGKDGFVHGRYLMPAVAGLAVLAAVGLHRVLRDRTSWAGPILLLVAATMHRMSVLRILGRFWGVPDAPLAEQVLGAVQWSPWPGPVTGGLAVVSALAGTWALWVLLSGAPGDAGEAWSPVASTALPARPGG